MPSARANETGSVGHALRFVDLYELLCLRTAPRDAVTEALRLGFYRADANEASVFLHPDAAPGGIVLIRPRPEAYVMTLQDVPSPGRNPRERLCILGAEVTEEQARGPFIVLTRRLARTGLAVGAARRLDLPHATLSSLAVSINGPPRRSRLAVLAPQTNPGNIIRSQLMVIE